MSDSLDRRDFLACAACAGVTLAAGCGNDDGATTMGGAPSVTPIGDVSNYPDSTRPGTTPGTTDMPTCGSTAGLIQGPMASSVGLNQAVVVPGRSNLFVIRDSQGMLAVDNACTHSGCACTIRPDLGFWQCPCHQSQFTLAGINFSGPAPRPLTRYAVCKAADGRVYIDLSKKL